MHISNYIFLYDTSYLHFNHFSPFVKNKKITFLFVCYIFSLFDHLNFNLLSYVAQVVIVNFYLIIIFKKNHKSSVYTKLRFKVPTVKLILNVLVTNHNGMEPTTTSTQRTAPRATSAINSSTCLRGLRCHGERHTLALAFQRGGGSKRA